MEKQNKIHLFAYGTLMRKNLAGEKFFGNKYFVDNAVLEDYALYDLEYYPAIIQQKGEKTKGELFNIPTELIANIDVYKGEGSLYKKELVQVTLGDGKKIEAYTYVYLHSVNKQRKVDFDLQPWYKNILDNQQQYVWYACYGSNTNEDRFMKYINRCEDTTKPKQSRPFSINYELYFGSTSSIW